MYEDATLIAIRESRLFERRRLASKLLRDAVKQHSVNPHSWTADDVDAHAKLAEDLAHALMRRLAAREEMEITHQAYAATEP